MTVITVTAARVRPVLIIDQSTKPAAETITRGQYVRLDTAGKWALGNGTSAAEVGGGGGIALRDVIAGQELTALRKGLVDIGDGFTALAYGATVFLSDTDGALDTAAGTVSTVLGIVDSAWASETADKLLRVNL